MNSNAEQLSPAYLPDAASLNDYKAFVANSSDWIWETDANHCFTYVSESCFEIMGFDHETLIGSSRTRLIIDNAGDDPRFAAHLATLQRREAFRDFIYKINTPRVKKLWMAISGHPRFAENGEFIGYRGSGRNLSGIVEVMKDLELARSERSKLDAIVDAGMNAVSSGIMIFDAKDRLAFANAAMKSMFAVIADKLVPGVALLDIVRESARFRPLMDEQTGAGVSDSEFCRLIEQRAREEFGGHFEDVSHLPDGRWVLVENRRLDNGMLVCIRSDITELKNQAIDLKTAKSEIEKSYGMIQTVLDTIPIGIVVYDENEDFVMSNKDLQDNQPEMKPVMRPGINLTAAIDHAHKSDLWRHSGDPEIDMLYDANPETWKARKIEEYRCSKFEALRNPAPGKWVKSVNLRTESGLFIGLRIDISDLKQQQNALAAKLRENELYENIIEAIPAAVYAKSPDLKIIYANSGWETFSGKSIDDALGKTDYEIYGDAGLPFMDADRQVLATGKMHEMEETSTREDGSTGYRLARKSLARGSDGSVYLVGITSNIDELKARENEAIAARTKAELAQNVLDKLSSPVLVKNSDGIFVAINKAFAALIGKPVADIIGKRAEDLVPAENLERATLYESGVMETGETAIDEHDVTRPDGSVFTAKAYKSRETLADGKNYLVVRIEDVSKFKERERALRRAQRKAEAADRAKSEFLANMSHEIRTPMNGVLGMAELLASTDLDDKQRTFADVIIKSGNALLIIINDILDFSKIDAEQMELDPEPFDLREAVSDAATLMTPRALQKDIEVIVRVDPSLPENFVGDVGRLRQVIGNLLANAVKFTDAGHVLIDVSGTDQGERYELTFRVTDTGIGIPEDKLQNIFEKFAQVDNSSTRRHEGTGLGLAISSSIVELMDGRFGVESTINEGSTFWFTVTLPKFGTSMSPRRAPADINGAQILVVDDNEVNRLILTEQMAAWGFDCTAVSSGNEGLKRLRDAHDADTRFDCMILDFHMPEADGLEVARRIRASGEAGNIPIVILSSVDDAISASDMQKLKIDGNLLKPARSSELLNAIVDAIGAALGFAPGCPGTKATSAVAAPALANGEPDELDHLLSDLAGGLGAITAGGETTPSVTELDILIAEDNEVNQMVFSQILLQSGYRFEIVGDGCQAVETSKRKQPRLILMDVSMPELNGLEATEAIRTREAEDGTRVPVIGVTAHALKGDREKCIGAGMDDYISKPISPDALLAKIEQWIGSREDRQRKA